MAKCSLKIHILNPDSPGRAFCGQIITPVKLATENYKEGTCLVCVDKVKLENGHLFEWRQGGCYDKTGNVRENNGKKKCKSNCKCGRHTN